jgi:hypothetical protein
MCKFMPLIVSFIAFCLIKRIEFKTQREFNRRELAEDIRRWMKKSSWPKRQASCKTSARGSLGGKKSNPDVHSIANEKVRGSGSDFTTRSKQ